MLTLNKISEGTKTITLGWTPPSGIVGYRFSSATTPTKYSTSWDPSKSTVRFSKAAWYKVEALTANIGEYPPPSPPGTDIYPSTSLYPSEVSP